MSELSSISGNLYVTNNTEFWTSNQSIGTSLTDALSILSSKSKNITEEKREWAQKIVDIHADLEYHTKQIEKLNKEFQELINPKKQECCSKK